MPAGNTYQSQTRANDTLTPGAALSLHWRVQPDDRMQSFLEIWLPDGAPGVHISVTPPGHDPPLPPLRKGESGVWLVAHDLPGVQPDLPERIGAG